MLKPETQPKVKVLRLPSDVVLEAIAAGSRTQKEIQQETKLTKDEIGDALANLLLWTKEIKTKVADDTRMYFLNETRVSQKFKAKPIRDQITEYAA